MFHLNHLAFLFKACKSCKCLYLTDWLKDRDSESNSRNGASCTKNSNRQNHFPEKNRNKKLNLLFNNDITLSLLNLKYWIL